jgi:hypothetical protein
MIVTLHNRLHGRRARFRIRLTDNRFTLYGLQLQRYRRLTCGVDGCQCGGPHRLTMPCGLGGQVELIGYGGYAQSYKYTPDIPEREDEMNTTRVLLKCAEWRRPGNPEELREAAALLAVYVGRHGEIMGAAEAVVRARNPKELGRAIRGLQAALDLKPSEPREGAEGVQMGDGSAEGAVGPPRLDRRELGQHFTDCRVPEEEV